MPLKITNQLILAEAKKLGWQTEILNADKGVIRYTSPRGDKYLLKGLFSRYTSTMHSVVADDKELFYRLASEWKLPIPSTLTYGNHAEALGFLKIHKRIVVKPKDSAHGNGVDTRVTSQAALRAAVTYAKKFSDVVLLQEFVTGADYRLLFIGDRHAATSIRVPAEITGDGSHTIRQLILQENRRDIRGTNYQKPLNRISLSDSKRYLGAGIEAVPVKGQTVQVVGTANIGTGGYAIDMTSETPQIMVDIARTIVNKLQLAVCGVDIMLDPKLGPRLIEINASPSFGLHTFPYKGNAQPVAQRFLEWLQSKPGE